MRMALPAPAADACLQRHSNRVSDLKLHLQSGIAQLVTGSGQGWVRVNATEYRENLVLTPDSLHPGVAPGGFDALTPADFASLLGYTPEIVLLGTGATQRFPQPALTRALIDARVGIEVMDTPAACRTFNILTGEGRRVVALLLVA